MSTWTKSGMCLGKKTKKTWTALLVINKSISGSLRSKAETGVMHFFLLLFLLPPPHFFFLSVCRDPGSCAHNLQMWQFYNQSHWTVSHKVVKTSRNTRIVGALRFSLMKKHTKKASQEDSIFAPWVVASCSFTASQMKTDYCVIAVKCVGPNHISSLWFH